MATYKHNDQPNAVVKFLRKIYNPVGFKKGCNATLAFILLGYLFGSCVAEVQKVSVWRYCATEAAPGEP